MRPEDKDELFKFTEQIAKTREVEDLSKYSGPLEAIVAMKEKELDKTNQSEEQKKAPVQHFTYDRFKFPGDALTILLISIISMNNKKANEVLKCANVRVYDIDGKLFFPKDTRFKRWLRKLFGL